MAKDYYNILGVDRKADDDTIKKAYKKLAIQYHPDKQVGKSDTEKKEAEEKFKDINEAYSILSDKQKRQQYDMFGTTDGSFGSGGMGAEAAMREFMRHFHFGMGIDDDFFGGAFSQTTVGSDMIVNVNLTFDEIFNVRHKKIKYTPYVKCTSCNGTGSSDGKSTTCPHCNGTGKFVNISRVGFSTVKSINMCPHCKGMGYVISSPCKKCGGMGIVREDVEFEFDIPNGATNNTYFDVQGKGNASQRNSGPNGNLRVSFTVLPFEGFTVSKNDPYDVDCVIDVSVLDCITGCEKKFKYADGKEYVVTIRPGVCNGHHIRMKNLGLYRHDGSRGFLNIFIREKMPTSLTKKDKELIDKLRQSKSFK